MKSIIAIVIFALVTLCIYQHVIIDKYSTGKPPVIDNSAWKADSARTDSCLRVISKKDSAINQLGVRIEKTNWKIQQQKATINDLKVVNENLLNDYYSSPTLVKCDSVVKNQQQIIREQTVEIDSLDAEAESYSRMAYLFREKTAVQDTVIAGKIKLIGIQKNTIERLSCAQNWGFKHKFWKWVMGWKCDPPAPQMGGSR